MTAAIDTFRSEAGLPPAACGNRADVAPLMARATPVKTDSEKPYVDSRKGLQRKTLAAMHRHQCLNDFLSYQSTYKAFQNALHTLRLIY
jgi:hypothetical protein